MCGISAVYMRRMVMEGNRHAWDRLMRKTRAFKAPRVILCSSCGVYTLYVRVYDADSLISAVLHLACRRLGSFFFYLNCENAVL